MISYQVISYPMINIEGNSRGVQSKRPKEENHLREKRKKRLKKSNCKTDGTIEKVL